MADAAEMASRYRKVEVRTWTDAKFREVSRAPANAQTLWLYLLCGPYTTQWPGLVIGREVAMADDLGWPLDGFRSAFAELSSRGMVKADWVAGVVVLVNALFTRSTAGQNAPMAQQLRLLQVPRDTARPESPNVIRSWSRGWSEVPESFLKVEYLRSLETFSSMLGSSFREAFREAFGHPSPNQDQDQEQDQYIPTADPGGSAECVSTSGGGRSRTKKAAPEVGISPEAWTAADELRARLLKKQPTNAISREPWSPEKQTGRRRAWAIEFQKLFTTDRRNPRQLPSVLRWLFSEDCLFVVHSPKALREKWDRITAAMDRAHPPDNVIRFTPERIRQIEESTHRGSIWGSGKPQRPVVQPRAPEHPDSEAGES